MDGWMDGWMDGLMDGLMDKWMDEWMDKWMDKWWLVNTYDEIKRIPPKYFSFSKSVFILPIFFFNHTIMLSNCNSIDDCAALYVLYPRIHK